MNIKIFLSVMFTFIFLFGDLLAQDKLFTIDEAVMGQYREFYPRYLPNLIWRGTTDNITFQDQFNLYQKGIAQKDSIVICHLHQINKQLKVNNIDTITRLPLLSWSNNELINFYIPGLWINYSVDKQTIEDKIAIPDHAINHHLNILTKNIAYTIDNNIYIANTDGTIIEVTKDKNTDIVNGDFVSRNEFGINDGLFWSNDGKYLAFYRKDNSKVNEYPLVDITKREAEANMIKYPMAGMGTESVSLGIYDISTRLTVYIEKDDTLSGKYLTNISWSPDNQFIYIQVLNRAQNNMKLNRYRVSDGLLDQILFEENHPKYVEPLNPILFNPSNDKEFIYQSRRDGFNHAYLFNTKGELIRQITQGPWEITHIYGIDKKGNMLYQSTQASPLQRNIYKVNIKNSKTLQLTSMPGTHEAEVNIEKGKIIDKFNSITVPSCVSVVDFSGKIESEMLRAENPLKGYEMPQVKIGTLKAADGVTDLYYRLIKPIDFDSTKKYPVIVYVYGGPHLQLITDEWLGGARLWEYYMAQKGYLMFSVDNRGSSNRGLLFENVIHRQCGVNEMKDQIEGIRFLERLGYADMSRIGVHGWSYGGFMTTSLMVNYPEIFKVGVAGGPVIDWKYYEVMYGERYMDTPEENPEGYQVTAPLYRVKQLQGKLLIIHGSIDPTVVWQNSLTFINECIKNKVQVDYFVYPQSEHNVRGIDRVHLMQKVTTYFDENLK
jgi:dipeptidyl-peptidase 4